MSTERLVAATELVAGQPFPFSATPFSKPRRAARTSARAAPLSGLSVVGRGTSAAAPVAVPRPDARPASLPVSAQRRTLPHSRRQLSRLLLGPHGLTASSVPGRPFWPAACSCWNSTSPYYGRAGCRTAFFITTEPGTTFPRFVAETASRDWNHWCRLCNGWRGCAGVAGRGRRRYTGLQAKYSEPRPAVSLSARRPDICCKIYVQLSTSLGLITVPLGGFFERPLARTVLAAG